MSASVKTIDDFDLVVFTEHIACLKSLGSESCEIALAGAGARKAGQVLAQAGPLEQLQGFTADRLIHPEPGARGPVRRQARSLDRQQGRDQGKHLARGLGGRQTEGLGDWVLRTWRARGLVDWPLKDWPSGNSP